MRLAVVARARRRRRRRRVPGVARGAPRASARRTPPGTGFASLGALTRGTRSRTTTGAPRRPRWRARRARKFPKTESRIRFARRPPRASVERRRRSHDIFPPRAHDQDGLAASATRATSFSVASAFPPAISRRRARGTSKRRAHAFAVASRADFGTEIFHKSLPRLTRLCAFDAPATTASAASFRKGAAHAGQETCGASWRRRRWKGEWAIETLMVGSVDRRAFRRVDDDTAENTTRSRRR